MVRANWNRLKHPLDTDYILGGPLKLSDHLRDLSIAKRDLLHDGRLRPSHFRRLGDDKSEASNRIDHVRRFSDYMLASRVVTRHCGKRNKT